jgi:hypothetical protein
LNDLIFNIAFEKKDGNRISDICKKYNVNRGAVYWSLNYFSNSYNNNSKIRNQIVLGSILGDGFIQNRNGKYIYRECHALDELEYLKWKYLIFDNWTDGNHIYNKNFNNEYSNAKEFATSAFYSNVFEKYKNLSIEEVINELNIFGLIIFLLDDGWYSNHSKCGNFLISSGTLNKNQLFMIQEKFKQYKIETQLIGRRNDISIDSKYNFILLSYLILMFDNLINIDIIKKKFGSVIKNYSSLLSQLDGIVQTDIE